MLPYKPDGYPDLSPYVIVESAEASMAFMETMFQGRRVQAIQGPMGKIVHAEIWIGEQMVMLADGGLAWPVTPAHLHLYVEDVDRVVARAVENGATIVHPIASGDDPDRRGGVLAPGGITWWLSTQI